MWLECHLVSDYCDVIVLPKLIYYGKGVGSYSRRLVQSRNSNVGIKLLFRRNKRNPSLKLGSHFLTFLSDESLIVIHKRIFILLWTFMVWPFILSLGFLLKLFQFSQWYCYLCLECFTEVQNWFHKCHIFFMSEFS